MVQKKIRAYSKDVKNLLMKIYNVKSFSQVCKRITQEYKETILSKNFPYPPPYDEEQFKAKVEYLFSNERHRDGKFSDYISGFIQYMHPEFDYRFYSRVAYNHRATDYITASMRTLMISSKMELYFEDECNADFDKFTHFYRHLHQISDQHDHFFPDIDDDYSDDKKFYELKKDEMPYWEVSRGFRLPDLCELYFKAYVKTEAQRRREERRQSNQTETDNQQSNVENKDNSGFIKVYLGYAVVNMKNGNARLVLDSRPFMWTSKPLKLSNNYYFNVKIPGDESFPLRAIRTLQEIITIESKGEVNIKDFGGWPTSGDIRNFRKNYQESLRLLCEKQKITDADADATMKENAIKEAFDKTLFLKVRRELGITKVDVRVLSYDGKDLPTALYVPSARYP